MGKINCIAIKNHITSDQIERCLKNAQTPIEKSLGEEYFHLKEKAQQTQSHSDKEKLKSFLKWYKSLQSNLLLTKKTSDNSQSIIKDSYSNDSQLGNVFEMNMQSDSLSTSSYLNENLPVLFYENKTRKVFQVDKKAFRKEVLWGPPESLRWLAWLTLCDVPLERSKEIFDWACESNIDMQTDNQIRKDLSRTLTEDTKGQMKGNVENFISESLYKILRAFSNVDKEVSYCQGMNFIVGFLLVSSNFKVTETFYLLLSIFGKSLGLRGFFLDSFPLLNAYVYTFNQFFKIKMPFLKNHFDALDIPDEVWISKWMQTLFTICLPYEACLRFFDAILSQGLGFIISLGLAIVKFSENDLFNLQDNADVIDYLKSFLCSLNARNVDRIILLAKKLDISYESIEDVLKQYDLDNKSDVLKFNKTSYDCLAFRMLTQKDQTNLSIQEVSSEGNMNAMELLNIVNGIKSVKSENHPVLYKEVSLWQDEPPNDEGIEGMNALNFNVINKKISPRFFDNV